MKLNYVRFCFLFVILFSDKSHTQETLPIYQDYLSDNVYLVHPSAAGIGNSSKLRFTARQQWAGLAEAPSLQTLSYHSRFGEEANAAFGVLMFNDKNGYHSQKGIQGTYAYHLQLSAGHIFEQLSFGLSLTFVQIQSDQRSFESDDVAAIIQSTSYYNSDFGVAYHLGGLSSYFTVKNLFLTAKNNLNIHESLDLRNYVFSAGYYYDKFYNFQIEPSFMLQLREVTGQRIADFNIKVYKTFSKTQIWMALSYRRSFDSSSINSAQFISPIMGFNFKNLLFSYTYTNQLESVVLTNSGYHQISLGINLWTKEKTWRSMPNINNSFIGF